MREGRSWRGSSPQKRGLNIRLVWHYTWRYGEKGILFMISRQKVKFLEYETLHCWKSWDLEFHIFCLYLENVLINALKYSFIEILNVLFKNGIPKKGRKKYWHQHPGSVKNDVPISRRFIVRRKIVFIRTSQGVAGAVTTSRHEISFFLLNLPREGGKVSEIN